jgi:glutathione S-transferase
MIKVYHAPRTRSLRVLWALEEMGLPYETAEASFREPSADFLAANPTRTIPAMVDGPAVMTESVAILQYLADRYGPTALSVKPDEPAYPDYLQFLFLGEAGLGAPLNAVVGTRFFGPEDAHENFTVRMVIEGFLRRLALVERQLDSHAFLAGDRFTMADISVAWTIGLGLFLGLTPKMPAAVVDYHHRLIQRPAFARANAGAGAGLSA